MRSTSNNRLMPLIFFTVMGVAAFGALGALYNDGPAGDGTVATATVKPSGDPGEIYMALDTAVDTGQAQFIYKGITDDDRIRIHVVIPDLDPEIAYVHLVDMRTAKKGFKLLGRRYRLVVVNKHRLRIHSESPGVG
jgi:hypothetical protein